MIAAERQVREQVLRKVRGRVFDQVGVACSQVKVYATNQIRDQIDQLGFQIRNPFRAGDFSA